MNDIMLGLPPNILRKTISDIEKMFPEMKILPHKTHKEAGEYFTRLFGRHETTLQDLPDIIITAYPEVVGNKDWIKKSCYFQTMPEYLPPLRSDLAQMGFFEPTVYFKVITLAPLVIVYNKNVEKPPSSWQDLLDERFFGKIICPPEDTPVPNIYRFYLRHFFGERAEGTIKNTTYKSYPLDINKEVDEGVYQAGFVPPAFARSSRGGNVVLCWPNEGALAVPIVAMMRKGACAEAEKVLDYLLSFEYQDFISQTGGLVPVREGVAFFGEMKKANGKLLWAGWDIYETLIEKTS
ncbi:MAG: ABC transporter substrate-binding protein [Proteobacteria bacterium]|nr:ABC transporter substrate-binding protein [Pseudomonadota bacterium]